MQLRVQHGFVAGAALCAAWLACRHTAQAAQPSAAGPYPALLTSSSPRPLDAVVAAVSLDPSAAAEGPELDQAIAAAASRGARYVVLPEFVAPVSRATASDLQRRLSSLARRHGVRLAAALPRFEAGNDHAYTVQSILWDRDGAVLVEYSKVLPGAHDDSGFQRASPWDVVESWDDGAGLRLAAAAGGDVLAGTARLAARGAELVLVSASAAEGASPRWREQCLELSRRYDLTLAVASPTRGGTFVFERGRTVAETGATDGPVLAALGGRTAPFPHDLGLPRVPAPTEYAVTAELIELGRELFFDRTLSRDGSVSCASCHRPDLAFGNAEPTGAGIAGRRGRRNVTSLLNVAFRGALFWDGASSSLEGQAKFPMTHSSEMDRHYLDTAARVRDNTHYARRFQELNGRALEFDDIARALASYQRTLVAGDSAFDRYYYGGDRQALTPGAARGLALFTGKAGCSHCHSVGPHYSLFFDQRFHNTGVGYRDGRFADVGFGQHSDARQSGQFLTPGLRNVAQTAPYMHDGSLATLEDVVSFYDRGGRPNPGLDPAIRPLALSVQERSDLVSFLKALTSAARFDASGQRIPTALARGAAGAPVAALVFVPRSGSVDANRAALAAEVRRAALRGARLVVVPEHALTGELPARDAHAVQRLAQESAPAVESLGALARELGIWLSVSALEADAETPDEFYIASLLFDSRGQVATRHLKLQPRAEWGDGAARAGRGNTLHAVSTPFGSLGLLSGDDIEEGVARLAGKGAATVLVNASWARGDAQAWPELLKRAAARHRVRIIVANLGRLDGRDALGESCVLEPDGGLSASASTTVVARFSSAMPATPAPLGLPPAPLPVDRELLPAAVELGRALFFEPRLSKTSQVSCSTCHEPHQAFTDGRRVALGVNGRAGTRNTPTVLNAVYRSLFAWDGVASSLEQQIMRALHSYHEMDLEVAERMDAVEADEGYRQRFKRLTGRDDVRQSDVARVIADYVRTLVAGDSPFDRYYYANDRTALSAEARAGLALFAGKAACGQCHQISSEYALFSDHQFHNTGVGYHERFDYLGYSGDGLEFNRARRNEFKGQYLTPSLRNVAMTAPYMHDGSLATLSDVVAFYSQGGIANPFLDHRLKPLGLSPAEQRQLVAFLESLTSVSQQEPRAQMAREERRVGGIGSRR